MKKSFSPIFLLMLVWPGIGLSQTRPPLVDDSGFADSVVVNGKIVSMDDRSALPNTPGHIHQAMAIKGKRIMALGTNEAMKLLAGPKTEIIDVGQKTVLPGLILTHYHLELFGAQKYGPQLGLVDPSVKLTVVADSTPEATAKRLRDAIVNAIETRNLPKGQWITVDLHEGKENRRGTTFTWIFRGALNRRQIDKGTESHPVLVKTGLHGIFNGAAIKEIETVFPQYEQSTDEESRPGAGKDGYAGVPEQQVLSFEYWWKDKPLETFAEFLRLQGLDLQKAGVTTLSMRILPPRVTAAFHLLNRESRMAHRLAYYVEVQRGILLNIESTRQFYRASGAPWTNHANGGEMLWLAGMSNEVWDVSYNEVCLGPDVPAPPAIKERERCPSPGSKPWETVKAGILNGWRPVQVHSTSSHGGRLYIQVLEEAMKEGNYSLEYMKGLRTTMEHAFLLGNVPDVMAGIKKFGIIVNVTPSLLLDVPENVTDYGEQLKAFTMPIKTWIDQGIRVTLGQDSQDVWWPIQSLVTGKVATKTRPLIPGIIYPVSAITEVELPASERIDRVTALKMVTTWASEYMLAEDTIGTLETGKYADFAVLDRDYFTVPVDDISKLKVVMTGLNGKIVYAEKP